MRGRAFGAVIRHGESVLWRIGYRSGCPAVIGYPSLSDYDYEHEQEDELIGA